MSRLLVCFLAIIVSVNSTPVKTPGSPLEYIDAEGNPRIVDVGAPTLSREELQKAAAATELWLYTRENPNTPQMLKWNDMYSVLNSNMKYRREIVIIIHGWVSNANTQPNGLIRKSYLDRADVNVISVDWRRVAYTDYPTAVAGVPEVGRIVGQFLGMLNSIFLVSYYNVHLIGFDMGAHIAGLAGRESSGKVARVTALSPAGELFYDNPNCLAPTDGIYVEAIHTDSGSGGYGISSPVGYVNVYPNGGTSQPGCSLNLCNHNRAYELFAASVDFNHLQGYRCTGPGSAINWANCQGESLRMGNADLRKTGLPGTYWVVTYRSYPY